MSLNERELAVYYEILKWEKRFFEYDQNNLEGSLEKYFEKTFSMLPEDIKEQFFLTLDNWLFHLHSIIQGAQLQTDARERILSVAKTFNPEINTIEDLKILSIEQRQYIAEQQISRHTVYSLIQGGLSGTGKRFLLGSDIPAMVVINLRVVQLIANAYGYDVNTPYEMMTSLKVFHAAILPVRIQKQAWEELLLELEDTNLQYFYSGSEQVTQLATVEQLSKQLLKAMVILLFKRKAVKGFPIISSGIGAGANYYLTRRVTDFAHKYYQMRYLSAKKGAEEA